MDGFGERWGSSRDCEGLADLMELGVAMITKWKFVGGA